MDRDGSQVCSVVVDDLKPDPICPTIEEYIAKVAMLQIDESGIYTKVAATFVDHQLTMHSAKEYVSGIVHMHAVKRDNAAPL